MKFPSTGRQPAFALVTLALLAACGGGDDAPAPAPVPEETRAQDARTSFTPANPAATTFTAMAAAAGDVVDVSTTSRWAGVLNGAAYQVEVPANWNGKLVMYAHGYAGAGNTLGVGPPSIRRYLIQNGYAWGASSYSKNYYDVRVGVEDTNALALEFNAIATKNSRTLATPTKYFITGHSMGGHITAAAIEDEATATAVHKVKYNGAVPMCGVVGDTELFNEFAAMQVTAQAIAGVPAYPTDKWPDIAALVTSTLFSTFNTTPAFPTPSIVATATGAKYVSVLQNITGGPRPMFAQGLAFGQSFPSGLWHLHAGYDHAGRFGLRHPEQERARHDGVHLHDRWRCRRLDRVERQGAEDHPHSGRQPAAHRRAALDPEGQWRVQDPGRLDPHAG